MIRQLLSEDFLYRGIPYTVTQSNVEKQKPLLFFFHGFQSNRKQASMGRVEALALLGYAVVSIDAYNHGERQSRVFQDAPIEQKYAQILEIITHTAQDAMVLVEEVFQHNDAFDTSKIDVYGVSMGGMIGVAFGVLAQTISKMVLLVSSPKLLDYYLERQQTYQFVLPTKERLDYYRSFDPDTRSKSLKQTKMFFCVGDHDRVVKPLYAETYAREHPELDILYRSYDTSHLSTPTMLSDAIAFLMETENS